MLGLPHQYFATSTATPHAHVRLNSHGLHELTSEPPREFGGAGHLWSPETLLMAAVADCFVLTFKAVAEANRLDWAHMECTAQGTLDREDGVLRFTGIHLRVALTLASVSDMERARTLLERAEKACLISNSLRCARTLEVELDAVEELQTA
jgi:peroxiredoxin-like protein